MISSITSTHSPDTPPLLAGNVSLLCKVSVLSGSDTPQVNIIEPPCAAQRLINEENNQPERPTVVLVVRSHELHSALFLMLHLSFECEFNVLWSLLV